MFNLFCFGFFQWMKRTVAKVGVAKVRAQNTGRNEKEEKKREKAFAGCKQWRPVKNSNIRMTEFKAELNNGVSRLMQISHPERTITKKTRLFAGVIRFPLS